MLREVTKIDLAELRQNLWSILDQIQHQGEQFIMLDVGEPIALFGSQTEERRVDKISPSGATEREKR